MIRRILIANRGEIACRVARTCRAMGIASVAVFSDADEGSPHLAACDQAVRIGPAPARESYLAIDRLVAAARATACDAVHPGYGFLAENADFARACTAAGLIFIGPSAEVIAALGSKENARALAIRAGVPVVPGFPADGSATDLPYPVLVKASAGGGGKGMRIVRSAAELPAALAAARREAGSAFGDDTLLVERYLEGARHIEIQILGDQHGNLVHLFERECTIQRRHQKIIEETPSPVLDADLRAAMGRAALLLAREVGYSSAGTVELMLVPDRAFYFLEVNTRLQVEHPVTEMVTGLDLVREQIRIAEGEPLGYRQADLRQDGHAIECRLYAEDAERGFLPASGRLLAWSVPDLPGVRVDAGVAAGTEVSIHYDPMLAKIACHAPSRGEALRRLARALEELLALGVTTNRELLVEVLRHPEFVAGRFDTHFLDQQRDQLFGRAPAPADQAAMAAALASAALRRPGRLLGELPIGWRNNPGPLPALRFRIADRAIDVRYRERAAGRFEVEIDGEQRTVAVRGDLEVEDTATGVVRRFRIARDGAGRHFVNVDGRDLTLIEEPRFPESSEVLAAGGLTAPMPGRVVKVLVAEGDECVRGQPLVILEAMKMEHAVVAAQAGRVSRLHVREGDPVDAGAPLVAVEPHPPQGEPA
jgi:propionyl-CoA carboxylase alpha chain